MAQRTYTLEIMNRIMDGTERGRPRCPCGFVGAARNIRKHRHNCDKWRLWIRLLREEQIMERQPYTTDEIRMGAKLYEAYCGAVGGVAFNGDPLPSWEEFSADESKEKQAAAWCEVGRQALNGLS